MQDNANTLLAESIAAAAVAVAAAALAIAALTNPFTAAAAPPLLIIAAALALAAAAAGALTEGNILLAGKHTAAIDAREREAEARAAVLRQCDPNEANACLQRPWPC